MATPPSNHQLRHLIPPWMTEHVIEIVSWFLRLRRRDVPTGISVSVGESIHHGTTARR